MGDVVFDCIQYICRGVWHTPCTPPPKPHRKPPPRHHKSAQFRAYAIRPYKRCNFLTICCLCVCAVHRTRLVRHRMNRIANHRRNIANPRNPGVCNTPLQAVQFSYNLLFMCLFWALHTLCTIPLEPHRKPPPRHRKSAQFRAYAIRPYGGANYWLIVICASVVRIETKKLCAKAQRHKKTCKEFPRRFQFSLVRTNYSASATVVSAAAVSAAAVSVLSTAALST